MEQARAALWVSLKYLLQAAILFLKLSWVFSKHLARFLWTQIASPFFVWLWNSIVALVARAKVVPDLRTPDQIETDELFEKAQRLYDASPLGEQDAWEFGLDCVIDAMKLSGLVPPTSLSVEFTSAVERLFLEESFASRPELSWSNELTLKQQLALRRKYRAQICFFENYDHRMNVWRMNLIGFMGAIFALLPDGFMRSTSDEVEDTGIGETEIPTFSVPLISFFDDPQKLIHSVYLAFYSDEKAEAGLFARVRDQLQSNLMRAAGQTKEQFAKNPNAKGVPALAKGFTGMELVERYFGGTALELMFSHPLSFSIPDEVRFEHCHILGGTGHGKTQLLQLLIYQDLLKAQSDGRSVIVIDSQGDMIRTLSRLAIFSEGLADRLVIVDPTDIEYPVALNMFDCRQDRIDGYSLVEREKLLNGVIELYSYLFGALLGAELTDKQGVAFKYLARLMLVIPNATIHTMRELMEDAEPYKPYIEQLDDTTRQFFETQFFSRSFAQTKQQIARRLWSVLSHSTLDRMFSQTRSSLDLFDSMNSGKIVLINTAKDLLKEDGSQVLGRFFISMIVQAAMERATIPKKKRTPCYVYVDEAQEYFDESVSDLLIQARKYNVSLTSAHQTLDQLSPALRSTMMTNTSTKLIGGVSAKDAKTLAEEMRCQPEYLQGIRKRKNETEFACWIRNHLGKPITLFVPLGAIERQPMMSDYEYQHLIEKNRERHCAQWDGSQPAVSQVPQPVSEAPPKQRKKKTPSAPALTLIAEPTRAVPVEPSPMGQGGQKHVYMQTLIKRLAEERGWRAIVEKPIADAAGRVDVSLERGAKKIACEISVTTTVDHELGNVRKCLEAEYSQVLVVAAEAKRLNALEQYMSDHLSAEERANVSFITPESVIDFLDAPSSTKQQEHQTVRGYKVKVSTPIDTRQNSQNRRDAITKIISNALKTRRKTN